MIILKKRLVAVAFILIFLISTPLIRTNAEEVETTRQNKITASVEAKVPNSQLKPEDIKAYKDVALVEVNGGIPDFTISQLSTKEYVNFSKPDKLGRTGVAMACLSVNTLPKESRAQTTDEEPSGWNNKRYDNLIEGRYLYNRCHVIGYQLCGDNGSKENLFTGTDYLNTEGMLYFENLVEKYINDNPQNHVLYRVSPMYKGDNLVTEGVQMEAFSVEDFGAELCFNVFIYNVQPGIEIDYKTGDSKEIKDYVSGKEINTTEAVSKFSKPEILGYKLSDELKLADQPKALNEPMTEETTAEQTVAETEQTTEPVKEVSYILNTNSKKIHLPNCSSVYDMKEKNKREFYGSLEEAIAEGYVPCKRCLN